MRINIVPYNNNLNYGREIIDSKEVTYRTYPPNIRYQVRIENSLQNRLRKVFVRCIVERSSLSLLCTH